MEIEAVIGTYDCTVKGYSLDMRNVDSGLCKKYQEKEHAGCVKSVASGDHYLATGGTDEVIKLYDMRKHTEIGTLLQHHGSITSLAFYRDKLLLSAGEDGQVCVWKCGGQWDLNHSLTGHKYAVSCVSVHPSGRLALSVGKDRTLRTWDLQSGKGVFTQRLKKAAELVVWSDSGDQYVLSYGALLVVHDIKTGSPVTSVDVGKKVNSVIFVRDTVLAVGSEHAHILLCCSQSGAFLAKLEGHTHRVKALCVDPSGDLLFSVSSDGIVKVWQLTDPLSSSTCVSSVDSGSRPTSMAVLCPDLKRVSTTLDSDKLNNDTQHAATVSTHLRVGALETKLGKSVALKTTGKLSRKLPLKLNRKKLSKLKRLGQI